MRYNKQYPELRREVIPKLEGYTGVQESSKTAEEGLNTASGKRDTAPLAQLKLTQMSIAGACYESISSISKSPTATTPPTR
jgi:hypothetical protein